MDGDYLEGRGRDVEVCEPGVLQVVKVALGQSVPGVNNTELHAKLENPRKIHHEASELLWILHLAPQNNSF